MKITKVRIKNMFGIKEMVADGKDIELGGKNGVGKSSFIDAVKFGLTNRSARSVAIRKGETEGEVIIETDSGLRIHRKKREGKADYKSVRSPSDPDVKESVLRDIFTELQLNPIEFLQMNDKEQNRIILDLIDFKWDLAWIKEQFGEIPREVDYENNILSVLYQIQAEEGYYFKKRQLLNRDAKNKKNFISEIGESLPEQYDAETWEAFNLGEIYRKIEQIRADNLKIDRAVNFLENQSEKLEYIDNEVKSDVSEINDDAAKIIHRDKEEVESLKNQIRSIEDGMRHIEINRDKTIAEVKSVAEIKKSDLKAQAAEYKDVSNKKLESTKELEGEATYAEEMKSFVNEYNRMKSMQSELEKLLADSDFLSDQIEKARELPGHILKNSKIPIDGLTVENGIPLINGLPINNLSDGEKLSLCVKVASESPNSLKIILLDGVEKLSTINKKALYQELKNKGVQFISTATDDSDELTVVEI